MPFDNLISTQEIPVTDIPIIALVPLKSAVASDRAIELDLVVTIAPPHLETTIQRPALNLGLVLDRSGSMSGTKLRYAKQAACYAVEQLLPSDRVSVTIFDDEVETLVPSTLASDKATILACINTIRAGRSTALHAGWLQGAAQVSEHLDSDRLNRVLLLSDGLANVGERSPETIGEHVSGLATRKVSTSTLGLGNDYDEDLLATMSTRGDGNFYHVESPQQLPDIFASELQGLMATFGRAVSLGVRSQAGVELLEVWNDCDRTQHGNYMLPNLVSGSAQHVALRLRVPPTASGTNLCGFRLAWDESRSPRRREHRVMLQLPSVRYAEFEALPENPFVREQVALLQAARSRDAAIQQLDRGDYAAASQILLKTQETIRRAPASLATQAETEQLQDLLDDLASGRSKASRKKARFQSLSRRRSR